ncbi:MAG: hypothetical protein ABSG57_08140 [Candidatus Bathyarchaeia archaeon]
MCGDKHLQYDQPRPSTGAKPRGFKPKGKTEKPDMATQISGSENTED